MSDASADAGWVRVSTQARGRATQEKILEATFSLVSKHGIDRVSINDVADEAGCSVGTVYHHFTDKKVLVNAMLARVEVQTTARREAVLDPETWRGRSLLEVLDGYARGTLASGRARPGLQRAVVELSLAHPRLRQRQAESRTAYARGLAALLLERRDEISHPDPELAIEIVLDQMFAMLRDRFEVEIPGGASIGRSDDVFVAELLDSIAAYLGIDRSDTG